MMIFLMIIFFIILILQINKISEDIVKIKKHILLIENKLKKLETDEIKEPLAETQKTQPIEDAIPVIEEPQITEEQIIQEELKETESIEYTTIDVEENIPSKPEFNFDDMFIGNILNRVGVVALILGVGFLLNYAFENHWVSPIVQVLIILAIGACFIYKADDFNKEEKYKIFSQGLAGAGISILYLGLYSASNLFGIIPEWLSFGGMTGVTVLAFGKSLRYDSAAVAALGLFGGFIAPYIMFDYTQDAALILGYIILFNALVAALLRKKPEWYSMSCFTLFISCVMFLSLKAQTTTLPYVLLSFALWALYYAIEYQNVFNNKTFKPLNTLNLWINTLFIISSLYYSQLPGHFSSILLLSISGALIYPTFFKLERFSNLLNEDKQYIAAALLSLIAFNSSIFTGYWEVIGLSLLMTTTCLIASDYKQNFFLKCTYAILIWNLFIFATRLISITNTMIFNERFLAETAFALSTLACSRFLTKLNQKSDATIFSYIFCTVLFFIVPIEVHAGYNGESFAGFLISALWLVTAVTMMVFGIIKKIASFRKFSIFLICWTILKVFILDLSMLEASYRIISFIGLGAVLMLLSYYYQRYREIIKKLLSED